MKTKTLAGIITASFAEGCLGPATLAIDPTPTVDSAQVTPKDAALAEYLTFSATVSDDVSIAAEGMNVSVRITPRGTSETDATNDSYADINFPLTLAESYNANKSGLFTTELPAGLDIFNGEGAYSAFFFAIDEHGYESTPLEELFRVCSPPTIEYISPSGIFSNDAPITLEASASAFCDIASLTLTGENLPETEMTDDDEDGLYTAIVDPTELSFPTMPYADFSCTLTATDSVGQEENEEGVFSIEDVVPPAIESVTISPDPADNDADTEVTFTATITDIGSGVDSGTVFLQLNEEGEYYSMTTEGDDLYSSSALSGSFFSTPATTYTITAADYAGLETTYTNELSVLNVTGLTFSDLTLEPATVSNAEGSLVDIIVKAGDKTDGSAIAVSCTLDGEDIGTLEYDGTSTTDETSGETVYGFQGTYDTSVILAATNYLATAYMVACTVFDSDVNYSTKTKTLNIADNLGPELSCSVTDGANDGSASLDILCTATDETAMGTVLYSSSLDSDALVNTSGDIFEASIDVTGVAAQAYDVTITAEDAAGNLTEQTIAGTVADALAPEIGLCSLSSSSISNNGGSATLTCTGVDDETAIESMVFDAEFMTGVMTGGSGTYTATIPVPAGTPADNYSVAVTASDGTSSTGYGPLSLSVTDGTAPELSCSATDGANDGTTPLEIICSAVDETAMGTVSYSSSLDSDALVNTSGDIFEASIDVAAVAGGSYDFDITATDAAGNTASTAVSAYVLDVTKPTLSCSLAASSISNANGSTTLTYTASDETGIDSLVYISSLDSGAIAGSGTIYTAAISLTASSTTPAATSTITGIASDTSGNVSEECSIDLTVTDETAPLFTDGYADPNPATTEETVVVYGSFSDETGIAAAAVTLDGTSYSMTDGDSDGIYETAALGPFSEGSYTLDFLVSDAAGNSTANSSETLTVSCTAATISAISLSDSEVYNDSNHGDITLSVDVAAGTCGVSIDTVSAELYNSGFNPLTRTNGHTVSLTLTDTNSDGNYVSDAITPYDDLYLGDYAVAVTATNTDGLSATASGSTPLTVSSICDLYGSGSILEAFVNGASAASLNTTVDAAELAAFDIIRLGSSGAEFSHALVNYDGSTVEDMDLSTCSGGTLSGSTYSTSTYDDCFMSDAYDGTVASGSVAIIISGSGNHSLAVNSSATGGTGPNWFYNTGTSTHQLDDGVTGSRANFSVSGSYFTICMNP